MYVEGEQVGARVALQNGLAESLETGAVPSYVPWERVVGIPHAIDVMCRFCVMAVAPFVALLGVYV